MAQCIIGYCDKANADKLLVFRWVQICAPLVADLFLFCYERDFMTSLSSDNQANIIEVFNSNSRYLDLLNIDNSYFEIIIWKAQGVPQ